MDNILRLSQYGTVRTCKVIDSIVTVALSDDFSPSNTMKLLGEVTSMFPEFPILETCICEENFALIILKK